MGLLGSLWLSRGLSGGRSFLAPSIVGYRVLSSATFTNPVLAQLGRVAELQKCVAAENSKPRKQDIIAEYPDLRELLELIYDPNHRAHVSYGAIETRLRNLPRRITSFAAPSSITELLVRLSRKEEVGHDAKDLVIRFLAEHGILDQENYQVPDDKKPELKLFGRILDRNLIAGFGAKTLSTVQWGPDLMQPPAANSAPDRNQRGSTVPQVSEEEHILASKSSLTRRDLKSFPVALGKSIEPPFTEIAKSSCKWYASRKLDGVRVLAFLDIAISSGDGTLHVHDTSFFSRTGKPFTSLQKVQDQLYDLRKWPKLLELLDRSPTLFESDKGPVKRLVLDGEVCVMREKSGSTISSKSPDDTTGAGAIWHNDNLEEDFTSTVSEIRRMAPYTISHPVYYIFDILPHSLFDAGKGPSKFSERVQYIRDLGDWLVEQLKVEKVLRPLTQWEIKDASEINAMVARAAEEGWEGLVLRADKPYKGSRSSDIRKFKKWQDAEYTVVDIENSRMRLAVNGVFGEYDAMANIWIEHKGVRVSVGSGCTADQRIKFGQNPELIVGKEVTVEYFSESSSSSREGLSLRFPRVKHIWTDGKRTI